MWSDLFPSMSAPYITRHLYLHLTSFCLAMLATETVWRVFTELQSDHKPIVVQLSLQCPIVRCPHQTFHNYMQAHWDAFATEVQCSLMALDMHKWTCIDHLVNKFVLVVTDASKKHIPSEFICIFHLKSSVHNPTFFMVRQKEDQGDRLSPWSSSRPSNCRRDFSVESGYQLWNQDLPGEQMKPITEPLLLSYGHLSGVSSRRSMIALSHMRPSESLELFSNVQSRLISWWSIMVLSVSSLQPIWTEILASVCIA